MATQLEIYNFALDMVSAKPVTAVDQVAASAEACTRHFTQAVEEMLRSHPWNFATSRATLTVTTAPSFEWDYAYTLPADFLRVQKFNGIEVSNDPSDFYQLENGTLLTDEDSAKIVYTRKPVASGGITMTAMIAKMDPLFVSALATLLASKIAPVLRQDGQETARQLLDLYVRNALPQARRIDGGEEKDRRYDPSSESNFIRARYARSRQI